MKLTVYCPERRLLTGVEVSEVTLPGSEGQIQVLPGHVDFIGSIETGVFGYKDRDGVEYSAAVSTGFFEVSDDHVKIMAETLELKHEIDIERARQAQAKAELVLVRTDAEPEQFSKYQLKLQRALIRQQVAGRLH